MEAGRYLRMSEKNEEYQRGYEQGVKDFAEKIKRYYNNLKNGTPAALVSFHVNEILKETLEGEK